MVWTWWLWDSVIGFILIVVGGWNGHPVITKNAHIWGQNSKISVKNKGLPHICHIWGHGAVQCPHIRDIWGKADGNADLVQETSEDLKPSMKFLNMLGEIKAQSADINSVGEFVGRWERIRVNVDSGANVPVMAPSTGKLYSVEASEGSRNGTVYQAANGGTLPNLG